MNVFHIGVLNHVSVMNVAMTQPQNGHNQHYSASDSTFFQAKLTRPRPGRGQMLKAKAEAKILASRPVLNITVVSRVTQKLWTNSDARFWRVGCV